MIAAIAARAGVARLALEAGAEDGVDDAGRAAERGLLERARARLGQALEVGARVAPQLLGIGQEQHVDLPAGLAQQPRHHQPVAAVVALADDHHDPALGDAVDG